MSLNQKLTAVLESNVVRNAILGVILFNAVILGLETSKPIMERAGGLILLLDRICLLIFVVELVAKLIAYRLQFFRKGWNIFDFVIVAISLAPAAEGFSALRALRILRVLRVISVAPNLRRVVEGFVTALPGMASVFLLMSLIFYIGAVMATKLFGTGCPQCTPELAANFDLWFGTLGRSGYSLFQIMTLESWSMGIVRPVMEVYPLAWMFFVPFIMMTTFAVVNLLVGLIVNSMQDAHQEESVASTDAYREDVQGKLAALELKLDQLIAARKD
ncbi:ion transporter [Sulfitobacter guttiformis]|uniref:Voltage-gated sodium channel n=1 Tax=Sulfitobacter guttiformis TaxID=74349 RepID=A0A420DRW1_9RHOB|nr:ion transporter [Sulfitobacter guttiformis]KIN74310.1 Ion transport protein [Sulfitobacter guttiformis KCTC 32187]RKE96910.1 voltage-gated sodium channel [Sulfitobacter guttiformis]